jgi:hypothetical protein
LNATRALDLRTSYWKWLIDPKLPKINLQHTPLGAAQAKFIAAA